MSAAAGGPHGPTTHAPQQYETQRRSQTLGGWQAEDFRKTASSQHMGYHASQQPFHQLPNSAHEGVTGGPTNINLQQATPHALHASNAMAQSSVPGSLQPGMVGRSLAPSSHTASSTVPSMPPLSTNNQYTTPSRSGSMTSAHSHSRSSPAGLEQKYTPYLNTPENAKFSSAQTSKYFSPQTPSGAMSHSPLGLADIRPQMDHSFFDEPSSANSFSGDGLGRTATNSNYMAPWAIYAYDWCKWTIPGGSGAGKMAIGSYVEDPHNFIQIVDANILTQESTTPGAPAYGLEFSRLAEATCAYPVTRILWEPPSSQKQSTDLLATSGDHLRLWSLPSSTPANISNTISRSSSVNTREPAPHKLTLLALLSNSKTPEHTAPLTSLDWNTLSPKLIITSSIDTTCTIWDIPTLTAKTQLIAHDKEVFDVRFCSGSVDVFVSCGADGSVRMFDLRSLEHSTIIYEPSEKTEKASSSGDMSPTSPQHPLSHAPPLLRVAASPHDSHLLATFAQDSNIIRILDVRQPGQALLELRGHAAATNCIEWSTSRRGFLASGGDDSLVLLWDLINSNGATPGINGNTPGQAQETGSGFKAPMASWQCEYEVGNLSWAPQSHLTNQGGDWLGVSGGKGVWGVKI